MARWDKIAFSVEICWRVAEEELTGMQSLGSLHLTTFSDGVYTGIAQLHKMQGKLLQGIDWGGAKGDEFLKSKPPGSRPFSVQWVLFHPFFLSA